MNNSSLLKFRMKRNVCIFLTVATRFGGSKEKQNKQLSVSCRDINLIMNTCVDKVFVKCANFILAEAAVTIAPTGEGFKRSVLN